MIEASGLVFARRGRPVIDGVDLRVDDGEMVGLVGPNGSGKTTLLRLLYGSLTPDRGSVRVDGRELRGLSRREVARRIAVVAQSETTQIALTVADTVMLGRLPHRGFAAAPTPDDYQVCATALNRLGVANLADRLLSQVSGGEAQRILIARALAQGSSHLLLDEPTNHLDLRLQHDILGLVRELPNASVVVLHDLNLAARDCDRVLLLDAGGVVAEGEPDKVFTSARLEPVYQVRISPLRLPTGRVHLLLAEDCSLAISDLSPIEMEHS